MSQPDRGIRRAALLLHGLPQRQRAQVLSRFDAGVQRQLSTLVAELIELGIPASLGAALEPAAAPGAEAASIALQACAPATIAAVLSAHRADWAAVVVDGLPEAMRTEVRSACRDRVAPLPPAVAQALRERLNREAHAASRRPPARSWTRWLRREHAT